MRGGIGCMAVCALIALGCGDDSGSDGAAGSGGGGQALESCNDVCEAQDAAEMAGNCPGIGLDSCKQLCQLLGGECDAEQTALNECQLTGTFDCGGLFSAVSDAECSAQEMALSDCESGGGACAGADASGHCPQVACPCPDGTQMISGQSNEGGSCACLDETTCQDLCF